MPNPLSSLLSTLRGLSILAINQFAHLPAPQYKGNISLPGLNAKVEIIRDRWGIPHIYANSLTDLAFAQGFTHAQERLFQMDFNRRLVAGRLSEILGPVSLPVDRWMRTIGLYRGAKLQEAVLKGEKLNIVQAYSEGVTAYIQTQPLPLECRLLNYTPEPWTPVDSLAWTRMMAWSLSVNWETEVLRAALIAQIGPEEAAKLEPEDESFPRVVPPGIDYSILDTQGLLKQAAEARKWTGAAPQEGIGSNNWVLHGSRTSTGAPILANDMHLGLAIPAIWFENHLVAENGDAKFEAVGVSFPGIPLIVAGHNRHVAWGFTNGFPDVQDLFIEKLRRTTQGGVEYEFKGNWLQAEVLKEAIRVKDCETVFEEVILTHHGPIINSLAGNLAGDAPLALRWTALEEDDMFTALFLMNQARDVAEFRTALRYWAVPVQNTVYADVHGNIAYSFPGKVPLRLKGNGRVPVPGWTGEYEWVGYVPFEELPHLLNPATGFVATANNRVVGDDYPHWLGYDHISSNRAERIVEMIEAKTKHSVEDIRHMHLDQISTAARRIGASLSRLPATLTGSAPILALFKEWDGNLCTNSPAAAIYEVFVRRLLFRLVTPKLGELAVPYAGKGPNPVLMRTTLMGERSREWLEQVLQDPARYNYSPDALEAHMIAALDETLKFLIENQGEDWKKWDWGKLHTLTLHHPIGAQPPLGKLLNRGPFPLGGDYDTVWATGSSSHDLNNDLTVGPPFRFIADLSDWNRCLGALLPGQSGHRTSPHYDDQISAWYAGEYHPMPFDRQAVESAASHILILGST